MAARYSGDDGVVQRGEHAGQYKLRRCTCSGSMPGAARPWRGWPTPTGQVVGEGRGGGANLHSAGELGTEKVLYEVIQAALGDRRAAAGGGVRRHGRHGPRRRRRGRAAPSCGGSASAARCSPSTTRSSRWWPAPTRTPGVVVDRRHRVDRLRRRARRHRGAGRRLGRGLRRRGLGVLGRRAGRWRRWCAPAIGAARRRR